MPQAFENFSFSYTRKGKPIFVPNEAGEKIGTQLKDKLASLFQFDSFVYHFKDGSHIAALHRHRANKYFCRVDIERFFYSIKRNRLKRVLRDIGLKQAEHFARWSTVKNPYESGGYVVPYGFIQSPILATLILERSAIGSFLRELDYRVTASVYMDDICLSANDEQVLSVAFEGLKAAIADAGFTLNTDKTREPAEQIDIFNCSLTNGETKVLDERVYEFYEVEHTPAGEASFERYCKVVAISDVAHGWQKKAGKEVLLARSRTHGQEAARGCATRGGCRRKQLVSFYQSVKGAARFPARPACTLSGQDCHTVCALFATPRRHLAVHTVVCGICAIDAGSAGAMNHAYRVVF